MTENTEQIELNEEALHIADVVGRSEQLNSCEHNYINIHCDVGWLIVGKECTKCGETI